MASKKTVKPNYQGSLDDYKNSMNKTAPGAKPQKALRPDDAAKNKTAFIENPKMKTSNQRMYPDFSSANLRAPIAKGKNPITKSPSVTPMKEPKKKR